MQEDDTKNINEDMTALQGWCMASIWETNFREQEYSPEGVVGTDKLKVSEM